MLYDSPSTPAECDLSQSAYEIVLDYTWRQKLASVRKFLETHDLGPHMWSIHWREIWVDWAEQQEFSNLKQMREY